MAPLPVITNTYRLAINWTPGGPGASATNVMHFVDDDGTKDEATLNGDFASNVSNNMWRLVSSAVLIETIDIIKLDGGSPTVTFPGSGLASMAGHGSNDFAPAECHIIKLKTGTRGRSHRGRLYLPFVGETENTGGTLNATAVAQAQAAWDTFRTGMATAGWVLSVASYKLAIATSVTTLVSESKGATQRRRMTRLR